MKTYIKNNEKYSMRLCQCNNGDKAIYKLKEKFIDKKNQYVGFWECCNCETKQPYKLHSKLFNLIQEIKWHL